MLNWKFIIKVIGMLLFIEAGLLFLCMLVGIYYDEVEGFAFFWPTALAIGLGISGLLLGRTDNKNMGRREGYLIVTFIWIIFTLIGMTPFLLSGVVDNIASAFFETMSGFTSTGATILDDIDEKPHCVLFWRSLSQWVGGIGIIFFTVAILPAFGVGEVKLFAAESTGPMRSKLHPRISITAKWIGTVYLALTIFCILSLMICGMNTFDAINYSMVITGTGGYGTHSAMLHEVFNSPAIEYVMIFFMIFSGINYTLIYYSILKGRIGSFFKDAELRCFVFIFLTATLICTLGLMNKTIDTSSVEGFFSSLELSFRESLFTVVSLQTTTGLATCDYTTWPVALMPVLLFVMFAGACAGSTSGGFKCIRWSIIYRVTRNEFKRIIHPRAVLPVKYNGQVINTQVIRTLFAFVALFVGALLVGAFVLAFFGVDPNSGQSFDYYDSLGLAMASLSNVGPGMGYYGPEHSWAILSPVAKYTCSFLMLIGRLEIFPVLILLTRGFWKKS